MSDDTPTRRNVLQAAGAGLVTVAATGQAAAGGADDDFIVGTANQAGSDEARRKAKTVTHEFDFGDVGRAVAGKFSEAAIENLEKNPNVRYTETDGEMHAIAETLPWGVIGVSTEATLHAVKVLDSNASGSFSAVAAGPTARRPTTRPPATTRTPGTPPAFRTATTRWKPRRPTRWATPAVRTSPSRRTIPRTPATSEQQQQSGVDSLRRRLGSLRRRRGPRIGHFGTRRRVGERPRFG